MAVSVRQLPLGWPQKRVSAGHHFDNQQGAYRMRNTAYNGYLEEYNSQFIGIRRLFSCHIRLLSGPIRP